MSMKQILAAIAVGLMLPGLTMCAPAEETAAGIRLPRPLHPVKPPRLA